MGIPGITYGTSDVGRLGPEDGITQCESAQLIRVLRGISEQNRQRNKIKLEILKRRLDKETSDVTHLDVLDQKIIEVEGLNTYLQTVIDHKKAIIARVQQPLIGDHIKLPPSCHEKASLFFKQLAPILAELSTHLNDLDWDVTQNVNNAEMNQLLSEVLSTLDALQTRVASICALRNGLEKRADASMSI